MTVVHRSLRFTEADFARIEVLRDRCGPRTTASEAVRTAIAHYLSLLPLKDVSALAEELAAEARAALAVRIWGISLLDTEAAALEKAVGEAPPGVRRQWSRTEIVRLAVLLFFRAPPDVVTRTYEATPRLARGRAPGRPSSP